MKARRAREEMTRRDPAPAPSRWRKLRRTAHRVYYAVKYFPFAKERRQRREERGRGFIAIQIDALAHEDLERALRLGYVPHLKRLIEEEGWELRKYGAGLPSATPAAQAAIFHGTKDAIPAFRFYEKSDRRVVIGSQPSSMQLIRDRLPADGVLENGSSYVNLYDGGAARVAFTLAAQRRQPIFEKMGGTRILLLLALHPIRVLRMVLASGLEYLREERDRLISHARGRYTHYWWYIPLLHIGAGVVLRELQTLAVMLDIYTGVPAIYTTYNVYDEFAHHIGPSSKTALRGLRALDRRIAEILRMRARLPGRPYDVYILSDHGQTPAEPYRVKYGETLGDTVINAVQHGVFVLASTGEFAPAGETVAMLLRELEEVGAASPKSYRRFGIRFTRWFRRHYRIFPLVPETVRVSNSEKLVVTYSSSLAHLYWTEPEHPLSLHEIRAHPDYRALYYFLVAHRGIGVVITRLLDAAHVENSKGRTLVTPDGESEVIEGEDPLNGYATTRTERRAIVDLVRMPNAGDLILFGAYDPEEDVCVCFDDQVGAHGAIGGRQFWPFLLTAPGLVPPGHEIRDPLDLYPLFDRYRRGQI